MKQLLILLCVCIGIGSAEAKRQKTTMGGRLRVEQSTDNQTETAAPPDTLVPAAGQVMFSGYDKTLTANKESFFVTNRMDSLAIMEICVEFDYTDMTGRQLHHATHRVRCDIPPGQTRQLTVPAWDKQHAFYYYRSVAPQKRPGTPYKVKSELKSVAVTSPD